MIEIFYYDDGKLNKGHTKELSKLKNKQIWIDITDMTKHDAELIKEEYNLHPLTIEDFTTTNTRIKVEEFPNYLFCIFYGIKMNLEINELDFVLGNDFIITNHQKEVASFTELKKNKEKLEALFKKGNDFIFHKLIDMEIDNYIPVLEKIDDQIETIEEEVTKQPKTELLAEILHLKRELIHIKKVTFPQREKIASLTKSEYKVISKKALPYFRDVHDHAIRVSDTVDNYREAIGGTFDVYMSAVSYSMNEVMKTLSIIATIALPLTVISGIYGTNFVNLPGSKVYYGFWIMVGIMAAVCGGMLISFKRRGWF